ncbi:MULTISPECIES: AmmeMemoRadiSam system protein B [unclassified Actinomyces]|uniref:AmmeMemoRadiSam system protein B n=1 Tax=unclassified Actinomyces TaxID=2609248 RepID=UPI0013A6D280|nr:MULTISPECIES: AmmeMemoRadiSam system protein B [unclassified Actinomyces]MBW3070250.1 AmmeMemoRadiSam system protein B [Actinomyces sp. 594]NDR52682.1 AmmeMemoRadiSam system protein B [Actinomyces sp. 565]
MKIVRRPAVAGSFYPGDDRALKRALADLLTQERTQLPGHVTVPKALVVPHAGYIYSGPMAARAYARLEAGRGRITRVVLLGPTHRVPVRGLALPGADQLATPLGVLEADAAGCAQAATLPGVSTAPEVHAQEHSLEVQLPFIQTVLGDVTVVPLAAGDASARTVADVISALWGGPETVIIISSDLSHYLPQDLAIAVDTETVARILALDSTIPHDRACGATPLNGMLLAAQEHGMRAELLGRCTSADTAGNPDRVVGYCAVALHEAPTAGDEPAVTVAAADTQATEPPADAGDTLLPLARRAIARAVGAEAGDPAELPAGEGPNWLDRPGAAFVTLRSADGSLRGCIGSLEARRPLGEDVVANAVAAALRDPRFPPVTATELPALSLEVSVLSTPERLEVHEEQELLRRLRPGVDGVVLSLGARRATFLPQVWDELPDPAEFLRRLKRKAGWPAGFWDAELVAETYRVRAWEES